MPPPRRKRWNRQLHRWAGIILLLPLSATSCIGSFQVFNNVLNWNRTVTDNKWVNELIFFGMWWIPVYEICLLGDTIIFNTIEFWTGENPMGSVSVNT